MTKVLAFSDIHGNTHNLMQLVPHLEACDKVIFLGDGISSLEMLPKKLHKKIVAVKGNGDFFCPLPAEQTIEIDGVRVFMTHGHNYGVKGGTDAIKRRIVECGADLGLYGHTHSFNKERSGKSWAVNVGSLGTSRTPNGGTYVEIIIDAGSIKEIRNCQI